MHTVICTDFGKRKNEVTKYWRRQLVYSGGSHRTNRTENAALSSFFRLLLFRCAMFGRINNKLPQGVVWGSNIKTKQ